MQCDYLIGRRYQLICQPRQAQTYWRERCLTIVNKDRISVCLAEITNTLTYNPHEDALLNLFRVDSLQPSTLIQIFIMFIIEKTPLHGIDSSQLFNG